MAHYSLLAHIKNTAMARKRTLLMPFSKNDLAIADILVERGYLAQARKKLVGKKSFLEVRVAYDETTKEPILRDFKIVSKPSRHIYVGYRDIVPVKHGYGIGIVSTPDGVVTAAEARKRKVGGEYLCEIW